MEGRRSKHLKVVAGLYIRLKTQDLVWALNKVVYVAVELFFAFTLSFFLVLLMPGNPYNIIYESLLSKGVPIERAKIMAAALAGYNPSEGIFQRYLSWMDDLFHGNLGYSIVYGARVAPVVAAAAPWTILVVTISLTLAFVVGFFLGLVAASTSSKALDATISALMSFFTSIPSYMLAIILLIVFSIRLGWLPLGGAYGEEVTPGFNLAFLLSSMKHLILPILTYFLMLFPGWMFGTRSIATSLMKEDYIMTARARGVHGNRMTFSYVGKNAFLPQYTSLLFSYGLLFGSSIFIETIFMVPGLGYILTTASGSRDYMLVMGSFIIIIVAVIIGNLIADLTYGLVDPRIRGR